MEEIKQIKITDKNYPKAIKKLSDAPEVLYYRGTLPTADEICVAVVGTRRPSDYGQRATLQITGELADAGVTVISGMAPGIDTFAHRTCVERGKRTIAVLGTGIDEKSLYPKSNLQLSRDIIKTGGCLITEYPAGTRATKFTFPQRNRIVVALSQGVVVIEAKEKSGSLITARLANEQKKELFAVPGPIYTLNSIGPNKLIKAGATLTESAQDVLDVLGIELAPRSFSEVASENPEEQLIFAALKEESLTIDAILKKTKLSVPVVGAALANMEISGKIRNLGGNTYSLN
ncbi:MAG: DNA-processing protein DprA [bacterium]|nr:DNA-processing protein DprA [bacterium]